MAITWLLRNATATNALGHAFQANTPVNFDTYTNNRFFCSFDMSLRLGYPGYASLGTEANVVAQWLFDEAAGNIVDEVAGITLTAAPSGTGLTYSVAVGSPWANLSPGIGFWDSTLTNGGVFESTTHAAALDLGLSDFVVEAWASFSADAGADKVPVIFGAYKFAAPLTAYSASIDFSTMTLSFNIQSGATAVTASGTIPDIRGDGLLHKVRAAGDRDGNLTLHFDEGLIDTQSLVPLAAASIAGSDYAAVGAEVVGSIYEVRLTVGNATNNSFRPTRIGTTADGSITRTETVISGGAPDPLN